MGGWCCKGADLVALPRVCALFVAGGVERAPPLFGRRWRCGGAFGLLCRAFSPLCGSSGCGGPSCSGGVGHGEHGQAAEVDGGGEQREIGGDLGGAADAGAASAVAAAHQVGDLAFHLRSGGAVVGDPVRVTLPGPGLGELPFVDPDADGASVRGGRALRAERAVGAVRPEVGGAGSRCCCAGSVRCARPDTAPCPDPDRC